MIVTATIRAPKDGRLFRPLLEWRENLKCYEILTEIDHIGQHFLTSGFLCEEPVSAPSFNP
jgi:hypothetical protein